MHEPKTAQIVLRSATMEDCRRVWEWRNDPANQPFFFDSSDIPFEDHQRWFSAKIQAPDTRIFVAVDKDNRSVGYVRFSITEDQAEISVAVDKTQRGKGYGTAAIKQGSDQLLATGVARRIVALVKQDNPASIAAFQHAGFAINSQNIVDDTAVYGMVYAGAE